LNIKGDEKMGMQELKKPIRMWFDGYEDLVLEYPNYRIIRTPLSKDNLSILKKEVK
jgi:hypothetical protein